MRVAVWTRYDGARHGFECAQCAASPELCAARGNCGGPLREDSGADLDPDGVWRVEASLAVSSGAAHLGRFDVCPLAAARALAPAVDAVLLEYRAARRLGLRADLTIPVELLLVVDSEVTKLQEAERARAERQAQARAGAAKHGAHRN